MEESESETSGALLRFTGSVHSSKTDENVVSPAVFVGLSRRRRRYRADAALETTNGFVAVSPAATGPREKEEVQLFDDAPRSWSPKKATSVAAAGTFVKETFSWRLSPSGTAETIVVNVSPVSVRRKVIEPSSRKRDQTEGFEKSSETPDVLYWRA